MLPLIGRSCMIVFSYDKFLLLLILVLLSALYDPPPSRVWTELYDLSRGGGDMHFNPLGLIAKYVTCCWLLPPVMQTLCVIPLLWCKPITA
jgi:hypothetical protein